MLVGLVPLGRSWLRAEGSVPQEEQVTDAARFEKAEAESQAYRMTWRGTYQRDDRQSELHDGAQEEGIRPCSGRVVLL